MPAIPHVIRRGAFYYWRRRLPSALAESPRSATLLIGLRTHDPRRARFLAAQITALADRLFVDAMDQRLDRGQLQSIFKSAFVRHLDKLEAVGARERMEPDFDFEESRRSDQVMGWVYRLLETRGLKAHVDERVRTQMEASGLDDDFGAEVDLMLNALRKNSLASERPERLERAITEVGGIPSSINRALSQQAIYHALASANFEVARRHGGDQTEHAFDVDAILRDRLVANESSRAQSASTSTSSSAPVAPALCAEVSTINVVQPMSESQLSKPAEKRSTDGLIAPTEQAGKRNQGPQWQNHPIVVLGEKLIEKNRSVWDPKTQRQAAQIYALFAKVLGEKDVLEIADIRQRHFADLDDLLGSVAKSYGKSPKDAFRTTAELRAIGAAKPPSERGLAPETLNRHLTFLGQLIPFMRSRGFPIDRDIDIGSLRVRTKARAREKRAIIDDNELAAIFNLPCFTGCAGWTNDLAFQEGPFVFHRALYFAIILLYYTGARREEVCGLTVDEVGWLDGNSHQPIPYARIEENLVRRIKNPQSKRFVPLHPELVRLGFFDYVEAIKAKGYTLVFPDLKSPTSSSPLGDRLYDEFSLGLRLAIPDAIARKKAIHSFRKTFGNSLKRVGVSAEVRGDMMGHAGATATEEIYCDSSALKVMLKEIMTLPVVTHHLRSVELNILPWVAAKLEPPFSRRKCSSGRRQANPKRSIYEPRRK